MRPYVLAECNWKHIKEQDYDLAVLPWGATEAHNYHLPYATDNIEGECIAIESARLAWVNGTKVIVLPIIPFGVNTGQLDIKLNINMMPSTQMAILNDIIDVLNRHGIKKLLIANSHGGNDFKTMIRELGAKYPGMFLASCNWFAAMQDADYIENRGDHAEEVETSLLLHLKPELVLPLNEAGDGKDKKSKINAIKEGWAWAERKWTQVTEDTGIGDPKLATSAKGEKFFKEVCKRMGNLFTEISKLDPDNAYE